jgi:hypothetical protein
MNLWVSIFLVSAIAGSCLPSGFAYVDVCNHEFEVFRSVIEQKCPRSLYPSPPIEVRHHCYSKTNIFIFDWIRHAFGVPLKWKNLLKYHLLKIQMITLP